MKKQYIVITSGSSNDAPIYNCATVAGVFDDLFAARAKLRDIADRWKDFIGIAEWKPGYMDACSEKWANNYYHPHGYTAWYTTESGFERAEIFTQSEHGGWMPLYFG